MRRLAAAVYVATLLAIVALAAVYRFTELEVKPLHSDEGVNGLSTLRIVEDFTYRYNPVKHHGPINNFLAAIPVAIGGRSVAALRFMPALFGSVAVLSLALFRERLGRLGVLAAAACVAVAPVEVYFSRTGIHEIYNLTFNFTLVGGLFGWLDRRSRAGLVLAAVSIALLFATKETTILTLGAMAPALVLAYGWREGTATTLRANVAAERRSYKAAAWAFVVFWALSFSSFGTNPRGLFDFFWAFGAWATRGVSGTEQVKAWGYFVTHLLWLYYRPVLVLGLVGLVWGSARGDRLARFSLAWFLVALATYTAIRYKTPWCVLSFSGPLFLGVGYTVRLAAAAWGTARLPRRVAIGLAAMATVGGWATWGLPIGGGALAGAVAPRGDSWWINLEEYDVRGHPFVYVQNVREYRDLLADIDGLSRVGGAPDARRFSFVGVSYPARYLLPTLEGAHWADTVAKATAGHHLEDVDVVAALGKFKAEVAEALGPGFEVRRYHERPGVKIELFVRKTRWDDFVAAARRGEVPPPTAPFQATSFSDSRSRELGRAADSAEEKRLRRGR